MEKLKGLQQEKFYLSDHGISKYLYGKLVTAHSWEEYCKKSVYRKNQQCILELQFSTECYQIPLSFWNKRILQKNPYFTKE